MRTAACLFFHAQLPPLTSALSDNAYLCVVIHAFSPSFSPPFENSQLFVQLSISVPSILSLHTFPAPPTHLSPFLCFFYFFLSSVPPIFSSLYLGLSVSPCLGLPSISTGTLWTFFPLFLGPLPPALSLPIVVPQTICCRTIRWVCDLEDRLWSFMLVYHEIQNIVHRVVCFVHPPTWKSLKTQSLRLTAESDKMKAEV